MGKPDLVRAAGSRRMGALLDARHTSWRTQPSIPENLQDPGMMRGMAGVGYGLLRIGQVTGLPCVLRLGA
jgi:lantibiotic modifying enzyme